MSKIPQDALTAELLEALKEILALTDDPANDADPEESAFANARAVVVKADAARAQGAEAAVKQLEWFEHPNSFPASTWSAQTNFGFYNIEEISASDSAAYEVRLHAHRLIAVVDGLPEAKSAAQADYEQRVRSALTAPPAPQPRPLTTVGEEAEKYRAERGEQWCKIFDTLRHYSMGNMLDEYGGGYPLVDLVSRDGEGVTIADGEFELVILTDEIALAIAPPAPQPTEREKVLEEALRPFANRADRFDGVPPPKYFGDIDCELRYSSETKVHLTVGDLRRARSALAGKAPSQPDRAEGGE